MKTVGEATEAPKNDGRRKSVIENLAESDSNGKREGGRGCVCAVCV